MRLCLCTALGGGGGGGDGQGGDGMGWPLYHLSGPCRALQAPLRWTRGCRTPLTLGDPGAVHPDTHTLVSLRARGRRSDYLMAFALSSEVSSVVMPLPAPSSTNAGARRRQWLHSPVVFQVVHHDHAVRGVQGPRHGRTAQRDCGRFRQLRLNPRIPRLVLRDHAVRGVQGPRHGRTAQRDCGRFRQLRLNPRIPRLVLRQGRVLGFNNVHGGGCHRVRHPGAVVFVRRKLEGDCGGAPPQHPPGKARGREGRRDHHPQDQSDPPDFVAAARREACGRGRWGRTGAVSGWRRRGGGGGGASGRLRRPVRMPAKSPAFVFSGLVLESSPRGKMGGNRAKWRKTEDHRKRVRENVRNMKGQRGKMRGKCLGNGPI